MKATATIACNGNQTALIRQNSRRSAVRLTAVSRLLIGAAKSIGRGIDAVGGPND